MAGMGAGQLTGTDLDARCLLGFKKLNNKCAMWLTRAEEWGPGQGRPASAAGHAEGSHQAGAAAVHGGAGAGGADGHE